MSNPEAVRYLKLVKKLAPSYRGPSGAAGVEKLAEHLCEAELDREYISNCLSVIRTHFERNQGLPEMYLHVHTPFLDYAQRQLRK